MPEKPPEVYTEVRLTVPRVHADAVCNYIIDNIAGGLVLEEEEGSPETGLRFYVPGRQPDSYRPGLEEYLSQVLADDGLDVPEFRERIIENVEWVDAYKKSVRPILVAEDVVIRPSWDASDVNAAYEIVLEPKMAFGTGSHETTRSCLKVIRQRFSSGRTFLDLGCGSGILSILASKLGAEYIMAIDCDVAAVENCRENFVINEVSSRHDILFGSIEKCSQITPFDFACVNIIKSVILPMLERLVNVVKPGGVLVLSGLLAQDEEETTARLNELGQSDFTIMPDNQWLTYVVERH